MATNPLIQHGAVPERPTRFAPIFTNRFFTGLWTQRNPLRDAATPYLYEKFYSGSRYESLIGGVNSEISNSLTIIRRPGLSVYNASAFNFGLVNRFYSFRKITGAGESIQVLADTGTGVAGTGVVWDITPPSTNSILSKSSAAGSAYFESIGNVLYVGDGADQLKYINNNGYAFQQWGIGLSSVSTGKTPGSTSVNAGTGTAWTSLGAGSGTVTTVAGTPSQALQTSNFSASLTTTDKISGVYVTFTAQSSGVANLQVQLIYNGSPIGTPKFLQIGTSLTAVVLGGLYDTWNFPNITTAALNTTGFGFQVISTSSSSTVLNLVSGSVTINTSSPPSATPAGSGSLATTNGGWKYVTAYGNSVSGHVSNASPVAATGNFTGKAEVQVSLIASNDGQVNQIRLFRTTDGGSTFFEHPSSPFANSTTTFNDTFPDVTSTGASNLNLFSQAVTNLNNSVPPAGLINLCFHNNRMWGSVGNVVYYSLPPNFNIGVGAESFPPLNFFYFPSLVKKLVATTVGLLVFTYSDIYLIAGNGTSSNPYVDFPFCYKIGLASYDALTIAGTNIILLSSASELVKFDPATGVNAISGLPTGNLEKEQIGFPIGDILDGFNSSSSFVTWHHDGSLDQALYVGNGVDRWHRWMAATIPEGTPAWAPAAIPFNGFGIGCVQSVETTPGNYQLFVAINNNYVYYRDLSRFDDNSVTYSWYADVGNIILAQPGQEADVDFVTVDCDGAGSLISVAALWNEISGTFQTYSYMVPDPTYLPASTTVLGERYYFANGNPQVGRHLQIRFEGASAATPDELLTYTIYAGLRGEK